MSTPELFKLLEHYLDKLPFESEEVKASRYEEFIDFLTEMIIKEEFP